MDQLRILIFILGLVLVSIPCFSEESVESSEPLTQAIDFLESEEAGLEQIRSLIEAARPRAPLPSCLDEDAKRRCERWQNGFEATLETLVKTYLTQVKTLGREFKELKAGTLQSSQEELRGQLSPLTESQWKVVTGLVRSLFYPMRAKLNRETLVDDQKVLNPLWKRAFQEEGRVIDYERAFAQAIQAGFEKMRLKHLRQSSEVSCESCDSRDSQSVSQSFESIRELPRVELDPREPQSEIQRSTPPVLDRGASMKAKKRHGHHSHPRGFWGRFKKGWNEMLVDLSTTRYQDLPYLDPTWRR